MKSARSEKDLRTVLIPVLEKSKKEIHLVSSGDWIHSQALGRNWSQEEFGFALTTACLCGLW